MATETAATTTKTAPRDEKKKTTAIRNTAIRKTNVDSDNNGKKEK